MARLPLELTLPLCLVFLQALWSYVYPHLPNLTFHAEHSPEPKDQAPVTPKPHVDDHQPQLQRMQKEVVFAEKSAKWLSPKGENRQVDESTPPPGTTELPLFPLSATFYALNSHPTLQIFEPRYRQLYHDVLTSGQNTFVVTAADADSGRLAAYGVVFRIDKVADVAEETQGQIKYIAEHTVESRVQIRRVLNPDSMAEHSHYLRALVAPVEDDPGDLDDLHDVEVEVTDLFESLVKEVHDVQAEIASRSLQVNASRDGGLWQLSALWLDTHARHRLRTIQNQLLSQVKEVYEKYASQHMQEQVNPDDMPPSVHVEVRELKTTFDAEMQRVLGEQVNLGQLLLQSRSHKERLHLLRSAFQVERLFAAAADPESMAAAFVG